MDWTMAHLPDLPPALLRLQTIGGILACIGLVGLVACVVADDLRAIAQDAIRWLDARMPDSERRR